MKERKQRKEAAKPFYRAQDLQSKTSGAAMPLLGLFLAFTMAILGLQSHAESYSHILGLAKEAARHAIKDVTYTVYTCSCSGRWTCSKDSTVLGTATSLPIAFSDLSQWTARRLCRENLLTQIGQVCASYGEIEFKGADPKYECTSQHTSVPPEPPQSSFTTSTGAIFLKESSHPDLGEAWREPSEVPDRGTIWGPVVTAGGFPIRLAQSDALQYCRRRGSTLPSREDFSRLREYMGFRSVGTGYIPQLIQGINQGSFWSSATEGELNGYYFHGETGDIRYGARANDLPFLCIRKP